MLVSILGDSISTYKGYNPKGYAVYYDEGLQERNALESVYDTWWAKVNQALQSYLCVNNSYSGSKVSGYAFPAGCCLERIMNLRTSDYTPDLILIYIGFNDFGYGVPISYAPQNNDGRINLLYFEDAYHQMLIGLRYFYPNAKIVCATLMRTMLKQNGFWHFPDRLGGIHIDDYNKAIRRAATNCHVSLADLAKRKRQYETLDGTHPTAKGHQTIADEWIVCLSKIIKAKCFLLLALMLLSFILKVDAQNTMRINYRNGSIEDIAIENIDSITFLEKDIKSNEASLIGDWLWGSPEQGYYELMTFNDDRSYIGYDNYFVYGFDSMTYGRYVQNGTMLTLQSNGYGYNRRYTWFIMGLTDNSLDVMTKMGRFSYYRLQSETVYLQVSGEPLASDEGDSFVFADGVMVRIVDGKLYGMVTGTTYIQKYIASENRIVSYRVVVEP